MCAHSLHTNQKPVSIDVVCALSLSLSLNLSALIYVYEIGKKVRIKEMQMKCVARVYRENTTDFFVVVYVFYMSLDLLLFLLYMRFRISFLSWFVSSHFFFLFFLKCMCITYFIFFHVNVLLPAQKPIQHSIFCANDLSTENWLCNHKFKFLGC